MVKRKGLEEENRREDEEEAEEEVEAEEEAAAEVAAGEEEVEGILILGKGNEQAPDISENCEWK